MCPSEVIDDNTSAGYLLRCAREDLGLSTRDVANALNLLVSHVRAIEANRCDVLAKDDQFLHCLHDYASLVDLDSKAVVDSYRTQSAAISEPIQPQFAESKQRHSGTWFGVGALAIVCVCLGNWLLSQNQAFPSDPSGTAPLRHEASEDKLSNAPILLTKDRITLNAPSSKHNTPAEDETAVLSDLAPAQTSISPVQTSTATQLRSSEWFTGLDADRYTLQLLSLTKEASSRAFIQSRHLEDQAAYFAVRNADQKTWYTITYGLYDSFDAAESASESLPDSLKDLKPRVRNTGRIQQIMLR